GESEYLLALDRAFGSQAVEAFADAGKGMAADDRIRRHEADIVAIAGITRAGIAQADNQLHPVDTYFFGAVFAAGAAAALAPAAAGAPAAGAAAPPAAGAPAAGAAPGAAAAAGPAAAAAAAFSAAS